MCLGLCGVCSRGWRVCRSVCGLCVVGGWRVCMSVCGVCVVGGWGDVHSLVNVAKGMHVWSVVAVGCCG